MERPIGLPRRTFLRGFGAAVALPMLDAMFPSMKALAAETGSASPAGFPKRMAFLYVPQGKNMEDWTPKNFGTDYDLSMILQPLAEHRKDFTLLTGFANEMANAMGDGGGAHARASATYLTGCHPRKTAGADIKGGISVDQIAAAQIGDRTKLPSIELSCDRGQRAGACDSGYSCAYQFNLSWKSETMPLNPEVNPRAAFERLFGSADAAESEAMRAKRSLYNKSILDFVLGDAARLQASLGAGDRRKLDEYLTAVREIEQRIAIGEKHVVQTPEGAKEPEALDYTYQDQLRLMYDIVALAFQADATRIATYILAHDGSNRPYPFIGIKDGHHDLSHHRNDPEKKAKIAQINKFHTEQLAYFLTKLKSIKEGDGNLLDNSMILYGSGISDGNQHSHYDLPILLAGRGGGAITPGRHLKLPDKTPLTNLYMKMLEVMGVQADHVGNSTGKLDSIV